MSRHIDADRLLNDLKADALYPLVKKYGIERVIDAQPTADVRENVRGEWKEVAERGLCDLRKCSNCGHIEAVGLEMITPKPNFCPNCGADMRGEWKD